MYDINALFVIFGPGTVDMRCSRGEGTGLSSCIQVKQITMGQKQSQK